MEIRTWNDPEIRTVEIEREKCACRGSYLDKFIQPALLLILSKGPSHGFQMMTDLEKSGMVSGDSIDPTGMYRTLKKMEAAGLVNSEWDVVSAAKPRRVYSLAEEGAGCLKTWQKTLTDYRGNIDRILEGIGEILQGE